MYNIYINEIKLRLTESVPSGPKKHNLLEEKDFCIANFYKKMVQKSVDTDFLIISPDPAGLLQKIASELKFISAAGGLVQNGEGAYLFIFRRGKWDLPKGKIDEGESIEHAAIREVEEECGLKVDQLEHLLKETYHIYAMDDQLVLKKTYWFQMKVHGVPALKPQLEEDITKAVWLKTDEFPQVKKNTYPLILEVMECIEL